jgi:hypothetical protein
MGSGLNICFWSYLKVFTLCASRLCCQCFRGECCLPAWDQSALGYICMYSLRFTGAQGTARAWSGSMELLSWEELQTDLLGPHHFRFSSCSKSFMITYSKMIQALKGMTSNWYFYITGILKWRINIFQTLQPSFFYLLMLIFIPVCSSYNNVKSSVYTNINICNNAGMH